MFHLDHVHIVTDDLDGVGDFLRDIIGAAEVRRAGADDSGQYVLDGARILLRRRRDGEELADGSVRRAGLDHLGLRVDDFEAAMARLLEAGCVLQSGPNRVADGLVTGFFMGPGGLFLEVLQRS